MEFEKAREFIMEKVRNDLPPFLYYHSFEHVMDVYNSIDKLAQMEGITGDDYYLLRTAVLFHDSGFVIQLQNHEEVGCGIARETLPNYGYSEDQIEAICGMIMATKIPQTPQNKLEEIICDADLDYLGRDDFWKIGNALFRELSEQGIIKNEQEWNRLQLNFLNNHHYFTESAKMLRQEKKTMHLNQIINIVESYID